MLLVLGPLSFGRLSGGNEPDYGIILAVTMHDDQSAMSGTHAKDDEPVLGLRMLGIIDDSGVVVKKDGLCLFE